MKRVTIELERETVCETPNGMHGICLAPQRTSVLDRVMEAANQEGLRVYNYQLRSERRVLSTKQVVDPVASTYCALLMEADITMTETIAEWIWFADIYLQ